MARVRKPSMKNREDAAIMDDAGKQNCSTSKPNKPKGARYGKKAFKENDYTNDMSWYTRIPSIVEPVTRVGFINVNGRRISLGSTISNNYVSPGFMTLGLTPSFGWSDSSSSAVNQAAKKLQLFLQHTVSNRLNFDQSDAMIYCMAMSNVYSYLVFLQRIYGTVNMYEPQNSYYPDAMLEAQGVNAQDLRNNIANFQAGINNRIASLMAMPVPAQMTIMQREAFLYKGYYIEGTSKKDQMYFYVPDYFFQYVEEADTGSALELLKYDRTTKRTVDQLLTFFDQLLNPILDNGSLREIGGVMLRAFGSNELITVAPIPTDFIIEPVFDIVVLEQMKNATVLTKGTWDPDGFVWSQDPSTALLYHNGALIASNATQRSFMLHAQSNRILTTTTQYTDASLVMENSRLMICAGPTTASGTPIYAGAEMCTSCEVYTFAYDAAGRDSLVKTTNPSIYAITAADVTVPLTIATSMCNCANFKFAPGVYLYIVPNATTTFANQQLSLLAYDLDNYATIPWESLRNIHDAAIQSLFFTDYSVGAWKSN